MNTQTLDLSAIIQAVVDRSGWVQGNSLAVLVSGSGERTAESYEGEPLNAPLLVVEYTTGGGGPVSPNPSQYGWNGNETGTLVTSLNFQNNKAAYGYYFTPLVDGQITQLGGLYNGSGNVRLFNRSTGEELASTTVTSSDNWSYNAITPVNVVAGTEYTVAAYFIDDDNALLSKQINMTDSFPQTYGDIQINASAYVSGLDIDPTARPTKEVYFTMYGQVDITFVPD